MKKRKDINEFLKQLEEAIGYMLDELNNSKNRPLSIDISVYLCPFLGFIQEEMFQQNEGNNPVDILETEKNIHAMIALPGMKKEDIELNCTGWALEITVKNSNINLNETIQLPAKVNKTGMKTTYQNGILEVVFNKSRRRGKSIQ